MIFLTGVTMLLSVEAETRMRGSAQSDCESRVAVVDDEAAGEDVVGVAAACECHMLVTS